LTICRILITFCLSTMLAGVSLAADDDHSQAQRQAIADRWGLQAENIQPAAVPGLYEVMIGSQIVYLSVDGRFLLDGDIVDLETQENLTEQQRVKGRKKSIAAIGTDKMITFPAQNPVYTISVFTDTDCTYCRKLHSEISAINDLGITVQYLLYPRYGPGSKSWLVADNVWCSDDRQDALTRAKHDQPIAAKKCATPVQELYRLGQGIGFRGTPAIVTSDGDLIAGYLPPQALLQRLNQLAAGHKAR